MAPTTKHVVGVVFILLHFMNIDKCYSATNVSLTTVLDSITKLIDYQRKAYPSLGLEGHFGLRVVEGQLKLLIAEYGKGRHRTIPAHLMTRIRQLSEEAMKVANMAIPHLHEHDPHRFVILRYEIQNPWVTLHPHRLINSSLVWDKTLKTDEIFEDVNLKCIAEATGTRNKEGLKCKFSDQCLQIMTEKGHHGYSLLHQLFFTALAVRVNCNDQLNKYLQSKNSSLEDLQAELCSNAYSDLTEKIKTYGIQMSFQDIFLKLEFICPNLGFVNFLRNDWLAYILSWQDSSGCFQREINESEKDKVIESAQSPTNEVQAPVYLGSVTVKPNMQAPQGAPNIFGYVHEDPEHAVVVDHHQVNNQDNAQDEHSNIHQSNEHQETYNQHPVIQQAQSQHSYLSDVHNNHISNGYHLNNYPEVNYQVNPDSVAHYSRNTMTGAENYGNQHPAYQQQNYPNVYSLPEKKHQDNLQAFHEVQPLQHMYLSPLHHVNQIQKNQNNHYYHSDQEKKPAAELNYNFYNPAINNVGYRSNVNMPQSQPQLNNNHLPENVIRYNKQHEQNLHGDPSLYNLGPYDGSNSYQHSKNSHANQNWHLQNPSHSVKQENYVPGYSHLNANMHHLNTGEHKNSQLQQGRQEVATNVVSPDHWHRISNGRLVPENKINHEDANSYVSNYANVPVHYQYNKIPKYDIANPHQAAEMAQAAIYSPNIDGNRFSYHPVQPNMNYIPRPVMNPNSHISVDHEHSHILLPASAHELNPQHELNEDHPAAVSHVAQQNPDNNEKKPVEQFSSVSRLLNTGGIQTDVLQVPPESSDNLQKNAQKLTVQAENPPNEANVNNVEVTQKSTNGNSNVNNKDFNNDKPLQIPSGILQNAETNVKPSFSEKHKEYNSNSLVAPFNKLNMQNRDGDHKQWQYPVQQDTGKHRRSLLEIDENQSEDEDGYYFDRDRHLGQTNDTEKSQKVYMYYYPIYEQMKRMNKVKEQMMMKKSKNTARKLLRQKEIKGICSTEVSGMAAAALVMYVRYLIDPGPQEFQHLRLDKPNGDLRRLLHPEESDDYVRKAETYKDLKDNVFVPPPPAKQNVLQKPQVTGQLKAVKSQSKGPPQVIEEKSRTVEYPDAVYVGNNNNDNFNAMGSHIAYLQHHLQTELGYHLIIIVVVSLACIFILYRYLRYRRFISRHRTKSI